MKVLVIGASGTIGQAVVRHLSQRHEVIEAGRSAALSVDMRDIASVRALFGRIGQVDHVIVAAGEVAFGPLGELRPEDFATGLGSKLMGQIHVAQVAQQHLRDGGSITLTSGILSDMPIRGGAVATTVNQALHGYVLAAAIELPRGLRINVVNPTVLEESLPTYGPFFLGVEAAPGARVALAYSRSVEGAQTGQIFKVW